MAQAMFLTVLMPASLNGIYVKNNQGEMVPAKTLVSLKRVYGPETVTRNNLFNAVTINGIPKPGTVPVMPSRHRGNGETGIAQRICL